MEEIALLDQYIKKLDEAQALDKSDLQELIEEITRALLTSDELNNLALASYQFYCDKPNLISDAEKLKAKLKYKRASLADKNERIIHKEEAEHEQRELDKLRLQTELAKSNITIHNTNYNENINSLSFSFNTARETVSHMTSLPDEDIQEVLEKIDELENIIKSSDGKSKKWSKAKNIVKWIADKGVDVGIALLPLLLQIK